MGSVCWLKSANWPVLELHQIRVDVDGVVTVVCAFATPSETASNDDASQMLTAASLKPQRPYVQALDSAANRLVARANLYLVPPKLANCDLAAKTMCELVKGS